MQEGLPTLDGAAVPASSNREGGDIRAGMVGKRMRLQIAPDILHRIQFGRVRRKQVRPEMGRGRHEGAHLFANMAVEAVPYQDDRGAQMAPEVTQEGDQRGGIDVGIGQQAKVQPQPLAAGRDAERGDRRDLLPMAAHLGEPRRVPSWTPGAPHQRGEQQATLIDEDQPSPQAGRFFLMRGHSLFTQLRIAASSRSRARRTGRCGLHPKPRNNRPM